MTFFDKIVVPVLVYGCETLSLGNLDIIEKKNHFKFCKYKNNSLTILMQQMQISTTQLSSVMLLLLKPNTSNVMVYGELRRYPLYIIVKSRIVNHWIKR
jgi:hypothetical protein